MSDARDFSAAQGEMPAGFSIEEGAPGERAEQVALFNACFTKDLVESDLAWRYEQNPYGESVNLLAREEETGELVSGYACNPRLAVAGESEAVVGQTGDVMTHPSRRKLGVFSHLDREAMSRAKAAGWPCVFGLPNWRSAHIFEALGWEVVGTLREWSLPLRMDTCALARRKRVSRLPALRLPFERVKAAAGMKRLAGKLDGYEVRPLVGFPEEVTELSKRLEARYGFMVRRDPEYLTWRFQRGKSRLHRSFGLYDAAGEFHGYVIVQLPREGELHGFVVDLLAEGEAREAAIAAGLAALDYADASIVHSTAVDGSGWAQELKSAGFSPASDRNVMQIILHANDVDHPVTKAARQTSRWYFTDGDRDDETM
ncbi:MAG: GNAT family N-acetyltransferase [Planctomycetes bacterium]|nr:GNAT family N-acetyltransferase [Planctomycetota bacterium]